MSLPTRRLALAVLPLCLVGCPSPTPSPPATSPSTPSVAPPLSVDVNELGQRVRPMAGAVEGFGELRRRFRPEDADRATLELEAENQSMLQNLGGLRIDSRTGGFTITGIPQANGALIVRVRFADGYSEEALALIESNNSNIISAGSTLVMAWLRDQLSRKLIFLPDCPIDKVQPLATSLQAVWVEQLGQTRVKDKPAERLAQFREGLTKLPQLQIVVAQLEADFSSQAEQNRRRAPLHTTKADYDAKVQAFTKAYGRPEGIGDAPASGT